MLGTDPAGAVSSRDPAPADLASWSLRPQAESSPVELATALGVLERATRLGLRLVVVFFASWTLVYQLALLVNLRALPTLAISLVLAAVLAVVLRPRRSEGQGDADRVIRPDLAPLTMVALLAGALVVALAVTNHRGLAISVLALAAGGYLVAERLLTRPPLTVREVLPEAADTEQPAPGLWLTGWFWALACGGLSMVLARPDGDDAYFVNLSQWVADRGTFPLRDTMISDEAFPAPASHSPPVHSIEALAGTLGRLTGLSAGSFTYAVMTPVLTVLAVLALTWLVQVCRLRLAPLGLTASVLFLLMSGAGASFGNFFALRMWQGKSVLAAVAIPLLTAFAIDYIRRGGRRRAVLAALAGVATVGASNTAVFLVPVLLAGLVAGALLASGLRRAAGLLAALAYPLACGVVILLLAPEKPSPKPSEAADSTSTVVAALRGVGASPYLDPLVAVPGHKGLLVATLFAAALGWLGLRSPAARTGIVAVVLAAAVALLPPVTTLVAGSAGVSSVVWRMWWVIPVPLLVAGLVSLAAAAPVRGRSVAAVAVAGAMGLLPLWGGRWIGSHANGARWVSPVDWKTPHGAEASARLALRISRPGDVILAPWDTSRVLADMSVDVHPVSARTFYLGIYRDIPEARAADRMTLQTFADQRTPAVEVLVDPLRELSVDTACVGPQRGLAVSALETLGYRLTAQNTTVVCLRR